MIHHKQMPNIVLPVSPNPFMFFVLSSLGKNDVKLFHERLFNESQTGNFDVHLSIVPVH